MSPDEVRNKTFHIAKRGYERGEVHRFLDGIASELETIRVAAEGDATDAVVVEAETVEDVAAEVVEATPAEPDSATVTTSARGSDDFDRVGNEISLMLRQAQESALKIRSDAEVEASTLVDQVRLDIEADRSAHEQAAQELIARTEDRAASLRREAETYSEDTRRSADDYASARRSDADAIRREVEIAAETDRKQASDRLAAASIEAEATMNEAQARAERLVIDAETEAQNRADAMLREAQDTLEALVAAEQGSRLNLEKARELIDDALARTTVSDLGAGMSPAGTDDDDSHPIPDDDGIVDADVVDDDDDEHTDDDSSD